MDNAGKVMAIMDPSNGKITIMPAYKDKIQIQPDIAQQVVKLLLKDRATQQTLFTIQPKLTHTVLQA